MKRKYRTLYCAEQRLTCIRETLAGFRTSKRVIREYLELIGEDPPFRGEVPWDWMERVALAQGRVQILKGELVDVDAPALRNEFERRHTELLEAHGMDHLDISEVRSHERLVTQTLSRWLFDQGAAGIVYGSNLDNLSCVALFEGRASVAAEGEPEPLIKTPPELLRVCEEFGLTLGERP